jgi:hypothetical protein
MSSNETLKYTTVDKLFTSIGQTWAQNYIWSVANSTFALLGFFLNILNLIVLRDSQFFSMPLYDYLRVYSLNGAIILLFTSSIGFCSTSYRLFAQANSKWANVYYIYLYVPVVNTGYFFTSVLDSLITLDRIACFKPQLKEHIKLSPYKASLVAYLVCALVNFPYFFVYKPISRQVPLNASQSFTLWSSGRTDFARSEQGTIVTCVVYALRDVLTMLMEIVLNVISLFYLKQYLKRKSTLLRFQTLTAAGNTRVANNVEITLPPVWECQSK